MKRSIRNMKKSKKLSKQVTITIPMDLLSKYKSIRYLRKAKVISFSELVRKAMYYYDEKLKNSTNESRVRHLNIT